MEKADRELLMKLAPVDYTLRRLYEEHLHLEKELAEIEHLSSYSGAISMREKEIKKQKLRGMDSIMSILSSYRRQEDQPVAVMAE